jgi:hypothetical protein
MVTDGIVTIFGIALMVMFSSVGIYVLLFILGGAAAMLETDGLYNLIGDFLFGGWKISGWLFWGYLSIFHPYCFTR